MKPHKSQKGTFEKVGECLYRFSSTGAYFALFKIRGKQTRVNLQTCDKETAKRKRDEEREKILKSDRDKANQTVRECVRNFIEGKSKLVEKSQHRYKRVLNAFADFKFSQTGESTIGDQKMGKITAGVIKRFHNHLVKDVSVKTSKDYLMVLKSFFREALNDKIIGENPTTDLKETRKVKKTIRPIPKLEQVKNVIERIRGEALSDTRNEAADFLTFLAGAGMGNAEASNLRVRDINWDEDKMSLMRKKTSVDFEVPLFPAIKPLLKRLTKDKNPDDHVFNVRSIKKSIATACKKLGYPNFTHRSFRKFFITAALDSGVDPRVVAKMQGHSDPKLVLQVYSEVSDQHIEKEAAKVNFTLDQ